MLGCDDNLIMQSAGKSIPVFAGTLYRITGIGELSATWGKKLLINETLQQYHEECTTDRGRGKHFLFVILFFSHACTICDLLLVTALIFLDVFILLE